MAKLNWTTTLLTVSFFLSLLCVITTTIVVLLVIRGGEVAWLYSCFVFAQVLTNIFIVTLVIRLFLKIDSVKKVLLKDNFCFMRDTISQDVKIENNGEGTCSIKEVP